MTGRPDVDLELVLRAQAGDVDELLRIVRPAVLHYTRARLSTYAAGFETAADVCQEVCLAVAVALPTYRAGRAPFMAFVYAIAGHKVADAQRAYARRFVHVVDELPERADPTPGPAAAAVRREREAAVHRLLEELPDPTGRVLWLRAQGFDAAAVGDVVGLTANAVRVVQHRGHKLARKILTS